METFCVFAFGVVFGLVLSFIFSKARHAAGKEAK